jgi:hypothetical protein
LRFAQGGISRAINAQFTAYGTYGEGITHKGSIAHLYLSYKQVFGGDTSSAA